MINARQRQLWEMSVAKPAPATPKDEPRPRTSTNPSAVLSTTATLVMTKGVRGAFNDRNTALVTALKIIGAIDTA